MYSEVGVFGTTGNTGIVEHAKSMGYSEAEIRNIPEGSVMGLGCGNPTALAELKAGETVLDIGSGGGVDVFLAAQKVGENGNVIGVDMTSEMLEKARVNAKVGSYKNVEFRAGEIENLPVEDDSIDVVISNCVVNLSPDKLATYKEVFRVLKPNGRVLISDIITEGELPEDVRPAILIMPPPTQTAVIAHSNFCSRNASPVTILSSIIPNVIQIN